MVKTIYAQLPAEFQNAIATTAGIVLKDFNPSAPGEAEAIQANILFATSGGVNVSLKYTFRDHGADIDNCPKNSKELLDVDSIDAMLTGTAVTVTTESALSLIGPADSATLSDLDTVTPRMDIQDKDFKTLTFVCPYGKAGGFAAVELSNALSEGGLSIQSTDDEKGKYAFSYRGFSSLAAPTEVPFKFYLKKAAGAAAAMINPEVP